MYRGGPRTEMAPLLIMGLKGKGGSSEMAHAFPVLTPVRFTVYPWIATAIQGCTDSFEGVYTGNAHSP
jgi:hypothetical protein